MKNQHMKQSILALAVMGISIWGTSISQAAVTPTGDTVINSSAINVGYTTQGNLTIDAGSQLTDAPYLAVGSTRTGYGSVLVTDPGSQLIGGAGRSIDIGVLGTGVLNIQNQGTVSASYFSVATSELATGIVNVVGKGSTLKPNTTFIVGAYGSGTLRILDGGTVNSTVGASFGNASGSSGYLTVSGTGSNLVSSGVFVVGAAGYGVMNLELAGTVTSQEARIANIAGSTGIVKIAGSASAWKIPQSSIYIGRGGNANFTIQEGGSLNVGYDGYIGYDAGSTGTIRAESLSTSMKFGGNLYAGYSGNSSIQIMDVAQIIAKNAYMGYNAGSVSTTTIIGHENSYNTNTGLTVNGDFYVGYSGNATVALQEGARLTSKTGYLGYNTGSTGSLTFSGTGTQWTGSSTINVGHSGTGNLTIDSGAKVTNTKSSVGNNAGSSGTVLVKGLNSAWSAGTDLSIGNAGTGSLAIQDRAQVTNSTGILGSQAGSTGTVNIQDMGSLWTNTGALTVGDSGTGILNITNGGWVKSGSSTLGRSSSSSGTALVSGNLSTWANDVLYVGVSGSAKLTVDNGGRVNTQTLYSAISDLYGNGTINASGAILDGNIIIDATHPSSQPIAFGSGGKLNLTLTSTSILGAGYRGSGLLRIADNNVIASKSGYLGYNSGSSGTAQVVGTGSAWNISETLYVGKSGSGSLSIEDGSKVSSDSATLGNAIGTSAVVSVRGPGSTWTVAHDLNVGAGGNGSFTIEDGGQLISGNSYFSQSSSASSSATVTGAGSTWNAGFVAVHQAGSLTVTDGATLTTYGLITSFSNLHGNGTINASGAVLDADLLIDGSHDLPTVMFFGNGGTLNLNPAANGLLGVGAGGVGSLRIAEGRNVVSSASILGNDINAVGSASVTGPGTTWTIHSTLTVGNYGSGSLAIEDGAHVTSKSSFLGAELSHTTRTGGNGSVIVSGPGSSWTTDSLTFGTYGNGRLLVENGGQVSSQTTAMSSAYYYYASDGVATITGDGSIWDNSGAITVGLGTGSLNILDGGRVSAQSITSTGINFTIRTLVSNDGMLVLGDASHVGSISTSGKIQLIADSQLAAGTYRPITEFAGRDLKINLTTFTGQVTPITGSTVAVGGVWDATAKTFTVNPTKSLAAGSSQKLTSGDRLLITDATTGDTVGASFGTITGTVNFSASKMTEGNLASLTSLISDGQSILDGWNFTTSLTGQTALLSYDLGTDYTNLQLWHLVGSTWSAYTPGLQSYDANGILSFDVTSFSGYAVTGTLVPEPATVSLLGLAAMGMLRRKRID